ncbi:MAG: PD-(D/E)XK nuclease family protein [Actinoplanes sp.]
MSKVQVGPLGLPAIYEDGGKRITTHSMLKQYLSCPKAAQYKYAERLKARSVTRREQPLKRGTWVHELLQAHYEGKDWRKVHATNTAKFNRLMDDEREELGDLPTECERIMQSYLWHYGANKEDPMHGWNVLGAEVTLEAVWPDSEDGLDIYRCRVDLLVEDEYGLLIVDHKTHKTLPGHTFRTLDAASSLYVWAARESGYDVRGFLWNYLRTKAPTVPKLVYVGTARERLSEAAIDTDYPTYARTIRSLGLDHTQDPIRSKLRSLRSQRWVPGAPQTSPFFRRDVLEKDDDLVARVVAVAMRTRDRVHKDFDDYNLTERNMGRHCDWCTFNQLCTTEMFGGLGDQIRRKQFRVGNPLDYYYDKRETTETS